MRTAHARIRPPRLASRLLCLVSLVVPMQLVMLAGSVDKAAASSSQITILEEAPLLQSDPAGTLLQLRQLGVSAIRVGIRWQSLAPAANSFKAPRRFNATSPAAYPAAGWAPYDAIVRDATADGITVEFDIQGGAPLWATGPRMPSRKTGGWPFNNWDPSPRAYGQFVRAVGTRYSGYYDPDTKKLDPGSSADLPRVHFWSIWNEPDYGPSLAPQAVPGSKSVPYAPRVYRALADQAWSALRDTGHGSDTIMFGELAPRGTLTFANFNGMTALVFMRALYCVDSHYRPLRGRAAAQLGCPSTAAGSRRFAGQNPVLFKASGVSDHPYMRWYPPNQEQKASQPRNFKQVLPDYTTLATIRNLENAMRRLARAYGSRHVLPVWDTEFGYQTSPPKRRWKHDPYPWVSQATAAYYDNWAEYISWKDRQIASFDQYLLRDPEPALQRYDYGGYASGLLNYNGKPKPGYDAFRLPLYMPHTTAASSTQALEVWGAVKPAHFVWMDEPGSAQSATVMFRPSGASTFSPLATIALDPKSSQGYFDTHLQFPSSGTVELQWTYPSDSLLASAGQTVTSRQVQVTVK